MARKLEMEESYGTRPAPLLNSIFMTTVNAAAKTLISVASNTSTGHEEKWKPVDHLRYILMLMIWVTVWVLRVMIDHFPCSLVPSPRYLLDGFMPVASFATSSSSSSSPSSSLELVLHEELVNGLDGSPTKAIARALSHIFSLLNDIPATSRKYEFAVAMAEKIVDENTRDGSMELHQINRMALSSAFAATSNLLYRSLQSSQAGEGTATWPSRIIHALPLGSLLVSSLKGIRFCLNTFFPSATIDTFLSMQQPKTVGAEITAVRSECIVAEKFAQELLWITNKLRACSAVDEALMQWSFASGLASLSLTANPRVQGSIVKISAILFRELARLELEAPRQVKFRLLVLWLPLFCYASNGIAYPVLTGFEKVEMERVLDEVISSLPAVDQEVILTNWLQDFAISASDWPNLQRSYDRWCRSSRKLVT